LCLKVVDTCRWAKLVSQVLTTNTHDFRMPFHLSVISSGNPFDT
jgi:hypothetical protein